MRPFLFGSTLLVSATIVLTLAWKSGIPLEEKPVDGLFQNQPQALPKGAPAPTKKPEMPSDSAKPNVVKSPSDGSSQPGTVASGAETKDRSTPPRESKVTPNRAPTTVVLGSKKGEIAPDSAEAYPSVKLNLRSGVVAYEVQIKKADRFVSAGTFTNLPETGTQTVTLTQKVSKSSTLEYRVVLHNEDGSSEILEVQNKEIKK